MSRLRKLEAWLLSPPASFQRKIAELERQFDDREIAELEMILMLSPDENAPESPSILSKETRRAFFAGVLTTTAVVAYIVVYGTGILHA
jgi:hypothetical protein